MTKGLGKGLGALIPNTITTQSNTADQTDKDGVLQIPIDKIEPNPDQPRKHFDHHALEELMASIKQHGILQPLVITPAGIRGKHQIIAGERRFRASSMLGLKKIPAIVRDVEEQQKLELAIVENIQRTNLNPIEEALAFQRLMAEFNLTQDEVAKRLGKNRSSVANTLRLLELPNEVQKAVSDGKISMGHAKILAGLEKATEKQEFLKRILVNKLSVKDLSEQTQSIAKRKRQKSQSYDPVREAQEEMLRDRFGPKVQIKKSGQKGQIVLYFYSLEELQRLLNELS